MYPIDSNAQAVVIADIGYSTIEGNNKNSFSVFFKRYRRVHILNKNAFDVATQAIYLGKDGQDEEEIEKIKARSEEDNCTVILSYIRKGNEFQFLNSRVL